MSCPLTQSCGMAIRSLTLETEAVGSPRLEAQGRKDFEAGGKFASIPCVPLGSHRNPPMALPIYRDWETRYF